MKSKKTASILALLFGGIGIHRFYLGQTAKGVFSIIFCWTYIPMIIGIVDFVIFQFMGQGFFDFKYNQKSKTRCSTCQNSLCKETISFWGLGNENQVCKICFQKIRKKSKETGKYEFSELETQKIIFGEIKEKSLLESSNYYKNNSIIDITGQSPKINLNNSMIKYSINVPKWKQQYIYSYSEINGATSEQKFFYSTFKDKFLKDIFIDLEGNTNYAFILLFDLLNDYDNHKNISKLEKQFKYLGLHYPKTKSYCSSFLMKKTSTIDFGLNADELKPHLNKTSTSERINHIKLKKEKEIQNKLILSVIDSLKENKVSTDLQTKLSDDSIIDVTNEHYFIKEENTLDLVKVPHWEHKYIYYFSEIVRASNEQKHFYSIFKNNFLNGKYLDLEGNTNYAFILLFDLLNEYEIHKDIYKLENLTNTLGQYYPKTKPYAISFLKQKSKNANYSSIEKENIYSYEEYWKLGNNYKDKLNLNQEEVELLNKIYSPSNNFFNLEYCRLEILKLYISLISELKNKYNQEGTTIEAQFLSVANVIAKRQNLNHSYTYGINSIINEFYSHIFKYCENTVREVYGHKRKLSVDTYYTDKEVKEDFETKIISKVSELLPLLISKVALPDEATEIELYSQNTNRWKIKFEELTRDYNENSNEFIDSIYSLASLNEKNASIENIFFEASKFISKYNKESALTFYIYYLHCDLKSDTFNYKQLTKTIQKSLFNSNEQLHDFEKIIIELIKDKDLDKALESVSKIYKVKRKKIQLNTASIKEVQQQHSTTVELLNEYLNDDFEDENNTIKSQEINSEEIQIKITQKNEEVHQSSFISELTFTAIHTTALELFAKSNFSVSQSEFEVFAKSKGVFKNQLIESINDTCYEFLDDVLIDDEDDYYTINTNYFQRISTK